MDELTSILNSAKFTVSRGYQDSRKKKTKDGVIPLILHFGEIFDLNTKTKKPAKGSQWYPEIEKLLHQIATEYFPQYSYNHIQINKNVNMKLHYDRLNKGDSYTFTLGDFTGGELEIESTNYDIYQKPKCFNGSKQLHGTCDWLGLRYCVIYYNKIR